jgi:predicted DNA-binding ribbon-helix-helix protein
VTLSKLVAEIDATRKQSNLSSAIRLFVLEHFQKEGKGLHSDRDELRSDESQATQS